MFLFNHILVGFSMILLDFSSQNSIIGYSLEQHKKQPFFNDDYYNFDLKHSIAGAYIY